MSNKPFTQKELDGLETRVRNLLNRVTDMGNSPRRRSEIHDRLDALLVRMVERLRDLEK